MAEQIYTVDKKRLRKFLGTMSPEFMNRMQKILDISLNLTRTEKIVTKTKTVYVDKHRDLNIVQIQLLAFVDIEEVLKISRTSASDEFKVQRILELFGFNLQKRGVQYLSKAILFSPKDSYFNIETLCTNINMREPYMEKSEIRRLLVVTVKERFNFDKSPTLDFIHVVNSFLTNKEG